MMAVEMDTTVLLVGAYMGLFGGSIYAFCPNNGESNGKEAGK